MLLDWFNAREAVEVGETLADYFLSDRSTSSSTRRNGASSGDGRNALPRFRKRVMEEAGRLKLNLFKRAKLLNSFKWRLLEHGFDATAADELTQLY